VGAAIAIELVIEVRVGIEVQYVEGAVAAGQCFDHRETDGVITAQRNHLPGAGGDGSADTLIIAGIFSDRDVAAIR
jgi:hypothetical protein